MLGEFRKQRPYKDLDGDGNEGVSKTKGSAQQVNSSARAL